MKEGQECFSTGLKKPDGFCSWAWDDFRSDLHLLNFGGDIPDTPKGVVYTVCSDAKRPVCFKLERLEE